MEAARWAAMAASLAAASSRACCAASAAMCGSAYCGVPGSALGFCAGAGKRLRADGFSEGLAVPLPARSCLRNRNASWGDMVAYLSRSLPTTDDPCCCCACFSFSLMTRIASPGEAAGVSSTTPWPFSTRMADAALCELAAVTKPTLSESTAVLEPAYSPRTCSLTVPCRGALILFCISSDAASADDLEPTSSPRNWSLTKLTFGAFIASFIDADSAVNAVFCPASSPRIC
mmetsp:Transcript_14900/g.46917  ORF Transcript_14900/g.46917 Transcript_14900/m.46917 type:complete len:231 (-) Transcript_14900:96-788(-)